MYHSSTHKHTHTHNTTQHNTRLYLRQSHTYTHTYTHTHTPTPTQLNYTNELQRSWYDVFYPPGQPMNTVRNTSNIWEVVYNRRCVHDTILAPRATANLRVPPFIVTNSAQDSSSAGGDGIVSNNINDFLNSQTFIVVGLAMLVLGVVTLLGLAVAVVRRRRQNQEARRQSDQQGLAWDDSHMY